MKTTFALLTALLLAPFSVALGQETAKPSPAQSDVSYGPHERNTLDFWKTESERPTALVFFLHGGGWNSGDKSRALTLLNIPELLSNGVSVVSMNYRYISSAQAENVFPPVKAPMEDAARALQFVRTKAKEWNIDTSRMIGAGASAGACTVLWLALQDDMADPLSDDPVRRESTRFAKVVLGGAQTSLDPVEMREWIPTIEYGAHAFGLLKPGQSRKIAFDDWLANRDQLLPEIKTYSPVEALSADDPAIWMNYGDREPVKKGEPGTDPTHSALFGHLLAEKCEELGVSYSLEYPAINNGKSRALTEIILDVLENRTPSDPWASAGREPKG